MHQWSKLSYSCFLVWLPKYVWAVWLCAVVYLSNVSVESWAEVHNLEVLMEKEGKICSCSEYPDLDWASVCGTGWEISTSGELTLYILEGVQPELCCNKNFPSADTRVVQGKRRSKNHNDKVAAGLQRQMKLFLWRGAAIGCPAFPTSDSSFAFTTSHIMVLNSLKVFDLIFFFPALALQSSSCSPGTWT